MIPAPKRSRAPIALCCGCGAEPRLPEQRYGKRCRNEAIRKHRLKRRAELLRLRQAAAGAGRA